MSSAAAKVPGEQPELFEAPAEQPETGQEEVVKVEAKDEPPLASDEGVEALKAQLEDLRQRERQAREQATTATRLQAETVRKAQDQHVQLSQSQYQTAESHLLAVSNAIVAAQSEADRAQADLVAAGQMSDFTAMGDAQRRLARSEARLEQLESGKSDLETRVQQHKAWAEQQARYVQQLQQQTQQQSQQQQEPQGDQLDRTGLPQRAKDWLRSHPDYLTDPRKNAKLQSLHWDAKEDTGEEFTDRYFDRMEEMLGLRQASRQDINSDERNIPVSAPVSRDPPSSGGSQTPTRASQVRLTGAQREAAKLSGITESEYAKNLLRMMKEKADGLLQ